MFQLGYSGWPKFSLTLERLVFAYDVYTSSKRGVGCQTIQFFFINETFFFSGSYISFILSTEFLSLFLSIIDNHVYLNKRNYLSHSFLLNSVSILSQNLVSL